MSEDKKVLEMKSLVYENKILKRALKAWNDHMKSVMFGSSDEWTNIYFKKASKLTEEYRSIIDD